MKIVTLIAVALMLVVGAPGQRLHADPAFDSDIQSRLARVKARQKLAFARLSADERAQRLERRQLPGWAIGTGDTPCGAIDLGNVENATISRSTQAVTVIIDGDVINANNNCR